jgi:glutamate-1-semialdehyde aminotransferase
VPGCAYGRTSIFKTFIGAEAAPITRYDFSQVERDTQTLMQGPPHANVLRQGMLLNGVDLMRVAGFVSAAHTSDIIDTTVQAFDHTIVRMQNEALLP